VREAWRCKRYAEKGKSMCASPTIYTDELDDIMRKVMEIVVTDKARLVHDMIKLYSDLNQQSTIKKDISKCQVEINEILAKKNKLLDLSIKGKVTDEEFEERNNTFNKEIAELKERIGDYQKQSDQNEDFMRNVEVLRSVISNELSFDTLIGDGMVGSLLDKIEVTKTEEKNVVHLKIMLKVISNPMDFLLQRQRGKTSVSTVLRTAQYI